MTLLADIIGSGPQLFTLDGRPGSENYTVHIDGTDDEHVSNLITVEVTMSESVDFQAEVTRFPVEKGIDIVDHRRIKPKMIKMSGVVSDAPSLLDIIKGKTAPLAGSERSQKAYKKLRTLFEQAEVITVITARDTFTNTMIDSFSIRKNDAGQYLGFDLSLSELQFATTAFGLVNIVSKDVGAKAPAKPKADKPPTEILDKKSTLKFLTGIFGLNLSL